MICMFGRPHRAGTGVGAGPGAGVGAKGVPPPAPTAAALCLRAPHGPDVHFGDINLFMSLRMNFCSKYGIK